MTPAAPHLKAMLNRGGHFARDAFHWVMEGVGVLLPSAIRQKAALTPWACVIKTSDAAPHFVSRSIWGDQQQSLDIQEKQASMPHVDIVLGPHEIYKTIIDLPLAAGRRLNRAVAARLDELSPIPLDDAAFSVRQLGRHGGRLYVEVAIARTSVIKQAASAAPHWTRRFRAMEEAEGEATPHVFQNDRSSLSLNFKTIDLSVWGAVAALLLLCVSFQARLDRTHSRLTEDLASLVSHLKSIEKDQEHLAKTKPAFEEMQKAKTLQTALHDLSDFVDAAPQDARVASLALNRDAIEGEAYIPEDQTVWSTAHWQVALTPQASQHPGYAKVRYQASPIKAGGDDLN
ncbi:MAG: hypothetical protein AAGC95_05955 [Pseudomonadota bacterium]